MLPGKRYLSQTWLDPRLEVRPSPKGGNGIFATRPIAEGEAVIVFGGFVFSKADVESGKAKKQSLLWIDDELWLGERQGDPDSLDYFLNILATPIFGCLTMSPCFPVETSPPMKR